MLAAAGLMTVGISSTALGANGDNWVVGVLTNSATATTRLVGSFNGSTLILTNTNTGATATPLDLRAGAGKAPMKVNSSTKVTNLNGDQVDGLDSPALQARAAMAVGSGADTTSGGGFGVPLTTPVSITVPPGQNFVQLSSTAVYNSTGDGSSLGDYVEYWAIDGADCSDLTGYLTAPVYDSVADNPNFPQTSTSMNYLFHMAPGPHSAIVCALSDPGLQNYSATVLLQTVPLERRRWCVVGQQLQERPGRCQGQHQPGSVTTTT